ARAAVTKAIGEVSALKTPVEECLSRGADPSDPDDCDNVAYNGDGALEADIGVDGEGTLLLTQTTAPSLVTGLTVTLTRSGDGIWECETSAAEKYTPSSCTGT